MKKIACTVFLLFFALYAQASVRVLALEFQKADELYVLNAQLSIDWNKRLKESLHHGMTLFFVAEAKITQKRWYVWNKEILSVQKKWQVSFHPITREYRLNLGGLHQSFSTFEDLEEVLSRVVNWEIATVKELNLNKNATLSFRFYLDTASLPKTFQIGIWGNSEWLLESPWVEKSLSLTVENKE